MLIAELIKLSPHTSPALTTVGLVSCHSIPIPTPKARLLLPGPLYRRETEAWAGYIQQLALEHTAGKVTWETRHHGDHSATQPLASSPVAGSVTVGRCDLGTLLNPAVRNTQTHTHAHTLNEHTCHTNTHLMHTYPFALGGPGRGLHEIPQNWAVLTLDSDIFMVTFPTLWEARALANRDTSQSPQPPLWGNNELSLSLPGS